MLNLFGHLCNSVYNTSIFYNFFNSQTEYLERNDAFTIPVRFNDIIFAIHSAVTGVVILLQCSVFEVCMQFALLQF